MENLNFRRKKTEFEYESREVWKRRYNRVSGLVADAAQTDSVHDNSVAVGARYSDEYTVAYSFLRNFANVEE